MLNVLHFLDGNCFCWAFADQLLYDTRWSELQLDHFQIRGMVVESLPPMIRSKQIDWDPFSSLYESPQQWMTKMKKMESLLMMPLSS